MTETVEPKVVLEESLALIASTRRNINAFEVELQTRRDALEATPEYQAVQEANDLLNDMHTAEQERTTLARCLALEIAVELGEKKPAAGVQIVKLTSFEILNTDAALKYCRDALPAALQIDKRTFKKLMLALPEPTRPDCVMVVEKEFGAVRIASKLDEHYPAEEADG